MASNICLSCGRSLGLIDRLRGMEMCNDCRSLVERKRETARLDFEMLLAAIADGDRFLPSATDELSRLAQAAAFDTPHLKALGLGAMKRVTTTILKDGVLSADDVTLFDGVLGVVGLDLTVVRDELPEVFDAYIAARINGGWLPVIDETRLILKKSERAHYETKATSLKHSTVWQTTGYSVRIMRGVYYRVSNSREMVGTRLQAEDSGALVITSSRLVFLGARKTSEVPYSKLLNVELFADAIRVHCSNRVNALTFQVPHPQIVAAMMNGAVQKVEVAS